MSEIVEQVSVRLNGEQKGLLDQLQKSFPAMPRGGLFLQLLYENHWNREAGNNKNARLERIEKELAEVKEMVRKLMNASNVEVDHAPDTD